METCAFPFFIHLWMILKVVNYLVRGGILLRMSGKDIDKHKTNFDSVCYLQMSNQNQ